MTIEALKAPFPHQAVSWRAQTLIDGPKAMALAYIDARDVMRRLDEAVGPENWQDRYEETARGRVVCTLSVRIGGEWVSKSDGAGDTDVEGEKGGLSDAFKRAAVKWGVGRYLYETEAVWAPCEVGNNKKWRKWKPEADRLFAAALDKAAQATHVIAKEAGSDLPAGPITDATRDWLSNQIDATGKPVGEFCKAFEVTSLKAITYEQLDAVKKWLRENRKAP